VFAFLSLLFLKDMIWLCSFFIFASLSSILKLRHDLAVFVLLHICFSLSSILKLIYIEDPSASLGSLYFQPFFMHGRLRGAPRRSWRARPTTTVL